MRSVFFLVPFGRTPLEEFAGRDRNITRLVELPGALAAVVEW